MGKNLGDYLHLYYGCECIFELENSIWVNGTVDSIVIERFKKGMRIKLLLRPLNDITDEELIEYGNIEFPELRDEFDIEGLKDTVMIEYYNAESFMFLLSKKLDLFGLIESGLANAITKNK